VRPPISLRCKADKTQKSAERGGRQAFPSRASRDGGLHAEIFDYTKDCAKRRGLLPDAFVALRLEQPCSLPARDRNRELDHEGRHGTPCASAIRPRFGRFTGATFFAYSRA
jgi:hypothetical protein